MKIESLNIGLPKTAKYREKEYMTGIDKKAVSEAWLSKNGFFDDGVANTDFHGGADRAVCFYVLEHYKEWEGEFKRSFSKPSFGENLTVSGMDEKSICIGDIFQIGEAIVQITQGRIPCATISKHNDKEELLKRIIETCRTGYFARVIKEGMIEKDSEIQLLESHPLKIDVHFLIETFFHQLTEERIRKILEINELAEDMRQKFTNRLLKMKIN
ncbi:MOSC domain-containing protein [Bacillus sp. FJAT-49736]|uniref:MOSC domain-containing protein n=1 Tax=Bacillus sp. FJAT-49736 TaxID=2833582 RepID=UPI001BC9B584|nr:MOSC domain-containing protein [Bacillus sp. FJAT-49736]MBS4173142.1 MOSC domain-containing protein [Bacillus sp. FJAT-49736]